MKKGSLEWVAERYLDGDTDTLDELIGKGPFDQRYCLVQHEEDWYAIPVEDRFRFEQLRRDGGTLYLTFRKYRLAMDITQYSFAGWEEL